MACRLQLLTSGLGDFLSEFCLLLSPFNDAGSENLCPLLQDDTEINAQVFWFLATALRPFFIENRALEHPRFGHLTALVNQVIPNQAQEHGVVCNGGMWVKQACGIKSHHLGLFPLSPLKSMTLVNSKLLD